MLVTILIWVAVLVALIFVLDLARHSVRRFLIASASVVARATCSLRSQLVRFREAVGQWQRLHLARLEAARLADAVDALERNYGALIGHDLSQLPDLRQKTHAVLRDLRAAYARDEHGLTAEPEWVGRLEAIAQTSAGEDPQSQRLARDMQETVLRIARMALEQHRQSARELLVTRRRLQLPLLELVSRLASLQDRLANLQRQAQALDITLKRFEQNRSQRLLRLPVYARAGGQWLLSAAGLVLAGLSVHVYQQAFLQSFDLLFPADSGAGGSVSVLAIWSLLGVAALTGWILVETRAVTGAGLTPLARLAPFARNALATIAGLLLVAVVVMSMVNGYLREWILYRGDLVESMLAGGAEPAGPEVAWVGQMLGGLLGMVLPLVVALAPLWLLGLLASSRVLFGGLLWFLLALIAALLQWLAVLSLQLRRWLPVAFDMVIFLPERIRRWRQHTRPAPYGQE